MTSINLLQATTVCGRTTGGALNSTPETVILTNPAGSGKAYRLLSVRFLNDFPFANIYSASYVPAETNQPIIIANSQSLEARGGVTPVNVDSGIILAQGDQLRAWGISNTDIRWVASWEEIGL